jgi:hypothetical protein
MSIAVGAKHDTDKRHFFFLRKWKGLQRTLKLRSVGIGDLTVDGGACAYMWVNGCTWAVGAHWCGT